MKTLFTIIFLSGMLSLSGQINRDENTVVIQTNDNYDNTYRKIAQVFTSCGFDIAQSDKDLGIISTAGKTISTFSQYEMKIVATVSGEENAKIILTSMSRCYSKAKAEISEGAYISLGTEWSLTKKRVKASKASTLNRIWLEMDGIISKYEDAEIYYTTQK